MYKRQVSRYLNGGNVSEKTKEKLKKVIEENNYQPNAFAPVSYTHLQQLQQ